MTPFVTLGYRFLGDPPGIDLDDVVLFSLGAGYKISDDFSGGLVFDYRQASVATSDDSLELSPYLVWKPFERWGLNVYGIVGLSDGSPNHGGGVQISHTW